MSTPEPLSHPVHAAVYAAEAYAAWARQAGHRFRDRRDGLHVQANRLHDAGDAAGDGLTIAHARTCDDAALAAFGVAAGFDTCADQLRELEAEVARLTAALAEAEQHAAGPFLATSGEFASYGRRLEPVIDDVLATRAEWLEDVYEPEQWAAVVAGWDLCVEHGVHLSPCLDDDGEPAVRVESRQGFWYYDVRLTVTDGQPVLSAERRTGGAR